MMISHKHKCIFVHIPRTAGMSIEQAFAASLGLSFKDGQCPPLLLSYNDNLKVGPPSLAHLSPPEYLKHSYISKELFESYFKFTFVRNPWARMISFYKYFGRHRMISFQTFLNLKLPELQEKRNYFVMPQVNYVYDQTGKKAVDFIGRFENLSEDFNRIRALLEHEPSDLRHTNASQNDYNWYSRWNFRFIMNKIKKEPFLIWKLFLFSPQNTSYQDFYNSKSKALVAQIYRDDIEAFDYTFGNEIEATMNQKN